MAARTLPTLPSFTAGQRLLASTLQSITTWGTFWNNPPMFRMRQTVAQSIPNAAVTTVTMDTSEYDTDSGRAAGTPWAYTIPTGFTGRWRFTIHVSLAAAAAAERDVLLRQNGTAVVGTQVTNNTASMASNLATFEVACTAGDVMTCAYFQQSGGAVNTWVTSPLQPYFEGHLVSLANP